MIFSPRPYQKLIGDFVMEHERCNVWAGMGMGKSAESIAIYDALRLFGEAKRCLVLAPKRVALGTWFQEVNKWRESFGHLTIAAAIGTPAQRIEALKSGADIITINYDNLEWLIETVGDLWPWDMVVADECFVAGTPVATPTGAVPIESLQPGDLVLTSVGPKKVVRKYEKTTLSLVEVRLLNGARIVCTPSHRFRVEGGWKEACELGQADHVFAPVHALQNNVCDGTQHCGGEWVGEVLQPQLLNSGVDWLSAKGCTSQLREEAERMAEGERCLEYGCANARGNKGQAEQLAEGARLDTGRQARREWAGHECFGSTCGRISCARLDLELPSGDTRHGNERHTDMLQAGLCMAGDYGVSGDRRFNSQVGQGEDARREKGICLERIGVESVSSVECTGRTTVWDIEVEDAHEYFAGGALVHNCTRLKGLRITLMTSSRGNEFVRGQGSVRAKALAKVAFTKVRRWLNLTGSPAPNGLVDQWGQNWFIDPSALGHSFDDFKQRWFRSRPDNRGGLTLEALPFAQKQIEDRVRPHTITIDPKDWFDLREIIETHVPIELPAKARRIYTEMEDQLFSEIEAGTFVEAWDSTGSLNKCLQIGNGFAFTEKGVWSPIHDEKIEALKSISAETNGESLLVVYNFVPDKERILKAFPKARTLDAPNAEVEFQQGRIPMLVVHPASAGHGLNLQQNCRICVDFSTGYNLEYDEQVVERVGPVRQIQAGFDRAVYRYRIVAQDTIEQTSAIPRIKTKARVQDSLKGAMKLRPTAKFSC